MIVPKKPRKKLILLRDGGCTAQVIKLDKGCSDFGQTMFARGGNIRVMFDYERWSWVETEI